ncbi:elongation factor EF-2 [Candidatus Woesearchaeota archaeon]|nr:MAG: elongation factor EF-2 [Candidatus Woesearchaeota archaeon]
MAEKMTDKVIRISKNPKSIRNIAICAHIDHGKTTFSDNLLAGAGMMSEELAGKARVTDFREDEQERGITIDSASVSMVQDFKGEEYLINLIDTPGHVDFGGDVTRAMRAVDGAITLVCASEGIMPQTETVLRQALKERVKPVLFINKVDRLIKELQLTPEAMQQRFMEIIANVNNFIRKNAPDEFKEKWTVNVQDGSVAFGSAFHNWALSVPYMQEKGMTFKDIIEAYESGDDEQRKALAKKAPLHEVVLSMSIQHHPNPTDAAPYRIKKLWHGDYETTEGKSLMANDTKGPLVLCVTKIIVDPQAGEIATARVFSGTVKKGTQVNLSFSPGQKQRIQQVFVMNGAKREIVESVPCGNIVGIAGLNSVPGETIMETEMEPFEKLTHIFDPVITKAIEAKKPSDLPKLIEVLRKVSKEDPSIKIEINEETGEHLMSGMGELHLEVIENRIKTEKGVDVSTSPPIVVYRESITKKSEEAEGKSPNKHNKLYFTVEPLNDETYDAIKSGEIPEGRVKRKDLDFRNKFTERGWDTKEADSIKGVYNGSVFVDKTRGIVYIGEIMELLLDMFEEVMRAGPVAREPCDKVKVILHDAKLHEDAIHRGPAQMYPAIREGIRDAMRTGNPILLEPMQTLRFEAPEEYMGEISKLISNKRGQLLEMEQEGAQVVVKGKLPVAEMFGMSSELRSATGGRGTSSLIDQNFERLPMELQDKVVHIIKQRKGLNKEE